MARGYSKDWPLSNWCCHWLGVAGITIKQDIYKVRPAAPPVVFVGLSTPLTIVVSDISAIFPINPSYWSYKSSLLSSGAPPCVYIYIYTYKYIYILYYIYNILYIYVLRMDCSLPPGPQQHSWPAIGRHRMHLPPEKPRTLFIPSYLTLATEKQKSALFVDQCRWYHTYIYNVLI